MPILLDNIIEQKQKIPEIHKNFLLSSLPKLTDDPRILAVGAGGSFISGDMDEFSDLDLILVYNTNFTKEIMADRKNIAAGLGSLLAAFTGEHVGEIRLLICLYGPPLLHVDFKFITPEEISKRIEDPVVLWERDNQLSIALHHSEAVPLKPDLQWIEDRFWAWIHYIGSKLGRGELFEAVDGLAFLRAQVLGPLALYDQKNRPSGVRRIETDAQPYLEEFCLTLSSYDASDCLSALYVTINLYRKLRGRLAEDSLKIYSDTEDAVMKYLEEIKNTNIK